MENVDNVHNNICISYRNDDVLDKLNSRMSTAVRLRCETLDKLLEIENNLDSGESHEGEAGRKKRRTKLGSRDYAFNCVPASSSQNDLDEIFGVRQPKTSGKNTMDLAKNDAVICILNRKKYKGIIFQISPRGLVIKTRDRKKIKLHWDNIDGESIQVIKAKNNY